MEIHNSLANLYRYVQFLRKGKLKVRKNASYHHLCSIALVLFQKSDHEDCYLQSAVTISLHHLQLSLLLGMYSN